MHEDRHRSQTRSEKETGRVAVVVGEADHGLAPTVLLACNVFLQRAPLGRTHSIDQQQHLRHLQPDFVEGVLVHFERRRQLRARICRLVAAGPAHTP